MKSQKRFAIGIGVLFLVFATWILLLVKQPPHFIFGFSTICVLGACALEGDTKHRGVLLPLAMTLTVVNLIFLSCSTNGDDLLKLLGIAVFPLIVVATWLLIPRQTPLPANRWSLVCLGLPLGLALYSGQTSAFLDPFAFCAVTGFIVANLILKQVNDSKHKANS